MRSILRSKIIRTLWMVPRIYNDDVYDYIIKLLNEGNTYDEIRKLTGVSKATISRIKKRYEQKK